MFAGPRLRTLLRMKQNALLRLAPKLSSGVNACTRPINLNGIVDSYRTCDQAYVLISQILD